MGCSYLDRGDEFREFFGFGGEGECGLGGPGVLGKDFVEIRGLEEEFNFFDPKVGSGVEDETVLAVDEEVVNDAAEGGGDDGCAAV